MVRYVWFGMFGFVGLVWYVCFVRYGLVCLVWYVWFGLLNEDDLRGPLLPLKVVKSSLELHFVTIPGGVGSVGLLGCWVGSNSDYKAISVQLQLQLPAGTELGNWSKNFDPKMFLHTKKFSVKKNFAPQKFWLKKFLSKKNWIEKFNQN